MSGNKAVFITVLDKNERDVLFEGMIGTEVTPEDLIFLGPFWERALKDIYNEEEYELVKSFKKLDKAELVASMGNSLKFLYGYLYIGVKDGVLRKSSKFPTGECAMMTVGHLSEEDCAKVLRCSTLEEVSFFRCNMREIGKEEVAVGMKRLRIMRLIGLKDMKSMGEEVGHISNLRELWIENCALENIAGSIGRLKQLEYLTLRYLDGLRTLPEEMGKLSSLKVISMCNCPIERLPKQWGELKSLRLMDLFGMDRLQLQASDMMMLSKLRILRINGCEKLLSQERALEAFCGMLKNTMNLLHLNVHWENGDDDDSMRKKECLYEAILENGSIIEGYVSGMMVQDVFMRNRENREKAYESVLCWMAIRSGRRAMINFPKEMMQMIGESLWKTRCDAEAWTN